MCRAGPLSRPQGGEIYNVVAFIGDGALSGGMAFEGLNVAGGMKTNLIVNDNQMAIAENHGGIYDNLRELRETNGTASVNLFRAFGLDYLYSDLAVIKALLPSLSSASRDFHRWRFNEMILETYQMAKKRKDTKTMEKAASSYAKYNRVDLEDEQTVPFDLLIPQPFTATSDPTVLGIKPIPNIQERIAEMLDKYRRETIDIEDIEFEEVDLEEAELFPNPKAEGDDPSDETT